MRTQYKIIADPVYGYLRANPIPSQKEIEQYYQKEFYSAKYPRFNDSSLKVQKEERQFFNSKWEAVLRVCKNHFGKIKDLSLFDIGFGFAQALLYFRKKGMKVSGLEPSAEGIEYARSQDLSVFQTGIEDFSPVKKKFDVVTLLNVLEHLSYPAETLVNIRKKLLKPGGLLVIDVPNDFNDFQIAADKEFGLKKWWFCPPNHLNYFSPNTLKYLLEKCGYKIRHCESSFPMEIFLLMGDNYVSNPELGKKCHQKRVRFEYLLRKHCKAKKLSQFYKALADLNLGRQIVVYSTY